MSHPLEKPHATTQGHFGPENEGDIVKKMILPVFSQKYKVIFKMPSKVWGGWGSPGGLCPKLWV